MALITVVIADDHEISRNGIMSMLGEGFTVVAEAETATEAIDAIRGHRPDVVLCDLQMPEGGGMAVVKACTTEAHIVIITVSEQERDLLDTIAGGALGYLVKDTSSKQLRTAVRSAARGEPTFSPNMAALVLQEFRRVAKTATGSNALSDREREVLQLVAGGFTNAQIGTQLFISPKTVRNHIANILDKLNLSKKTDLIRYAAQGRI